MESNATRPEGVEMIQSVERAVLILQAIQYARHSSLGDLAGAVGLPRSTVHGILQTLLAYDLVSQDPQSSQYRLGPAMLRFGNSYLDTIELRAQATPWAAELARRTGLAVRVAVLVGTDVLIVDHEPRPDGSHQMSELGITIPAHACAVGKAVLAFDAEAAKAVLAAPDRRTMTGETRTDPEGLGAELDDVRAAGIAWERDEAVLGESGVAAAIFDRTDGVVGSIGVTLPTAEWPVDKKVLVDLREAARNVSRLLGARRWPAQPGPPGVRGS